MFEEQLWISKLIFDSQNIAQPTNCAKINIIKYYSTVCLSKRLVFKNLKNFNCVEYQHILLPTL
jgi:hypothetical protein